MLETLQGTAVRRAKLACGQTQGLHFSIWFQSQGRDPHACYSDAVFLCIWTRGARLLARNLEYFDVQHFIYLGASDCKV